MKSLRLSKFVSLAVLLIVLPWAFAQGTQGGGGGTGTGAGTGGGAPPPRVAPPPTMVTPAPETRLPNLQAIPETIFITGSVVQEDGVPPPFGTVIELDCGDTITREAIVDSSGHYGFQLGSNDRVGRVMPDASDRMGEDPFDLSASSNRSGSPFGSAASMNRTPLSVRLMRCELRAQYPGFQSSSVRMDPGKTTGYTEVGNIVVYRRAKIQGTSVSVTSMLAPKDARKAMDRAEKALKKDQFAEAEGFLKSAIQIYPKNAEAWYMLGRTYQFQKNDQDARESYEKALDIDGNFVRPYIPLARLATAEKNWEDAADLTDKALELDPISFPEAYMLNALSHYHLDHMSVAEKSARKGQRLDVSSQYPQLHLVLAGVLARNNDEPGSLEELRQYVKIAPHAANTPQVRSWIEEKERLLKAANK